MNNDPQNRSKELEQIFAFFKENKDTLPDDLDIEKAEKLILRLEELEPPLTLEEINIIFDFLTWDLYGIYNVFYNVIAPFLDKHPEVLLERSTIGNFPLSEFKEQRLVNGDWVDFGTNIRPENLEDICNHEEVPLPFWEEILAYLLHKYDSYSETTLTKIGNHLREKGIFTYMALSGNDDLFIMGALEKMEVPFIEKRP